MPPSSTSKPCTEFCCSDVAHFRERVDYPPDSDHLSNAIHAIFARQKWSNISTAQYDNFLSYALRFASQCIATDTFAKYLVTMVDGDMYEVDLDSGGDPFKKGRNTSWEILWKERFRREVIGDDPPTARYPRKGEEQVTDRMRERRDELMVLMVDMVEWSIDSTTAVEPGARGYCEVISYPLPAGPLREHFGHGQRSRVVVSKAMYESALDSLRKHKRDPVVFSGLFELAVTILHELAHAVQCAIKIDGAPESFYQDSSIAEAGLELVSQLFGGQVGSYPVVRLGLPHQHDMSDRCVAVTEWPSNATIASYRRTGRDIARGQRKEPVTMYHLLPSSVIVPFFTDSFWKDAGSRVALAPIVQRGSPMRWMFRLGQGGLHVCSLSHKNLSGEAANRLADVVRRQKGLKGSGGA